MAQAAVHASRHPGTTGIMLYTAVMIRIMQARGALEVPGAEFKLLLLVPGIRARFAGGIWAGPKFGLHWKLPPGPTF